MKTTTLLGGLALGALVAATARADGYSSTYFGTWRGARFGCQSPYEGPGTLLWATDSSEVELHAAGVLYPGSVQQPERLYELAATARLDSIGRDTLSDATWQAAGHGWSALVGGEHPLAGFINYFLNGPRQGNPSTIFIRGTGPIVHLDEAGHETGRCEVDWVFNGQERPARPKPPPKGKWTKLPARPYLQLKSSVHPPSGSRKRKPPGDSLAAAVTPCAAETLCFAASPKAAPELLVRSFVLPGGFVGIAYLPLSANVADAWSLRAGETDANARAWQLAPVAAGGIGRFGIVDLAGYVPPPGHAAESGSDENEVGTGGEAEELAEEPPAKGPPPPDGDWISTPAFPGFRFKALLGDVTLVQSAACPKQTLCLGTAAAIPAQLFARVTARQANGWRWVLAGKLADPGAQLWVQQGTAGEIRYYGLGERPVDGSWLPAVADNQAFSN